MSEGKSHFTSMWGLATQGRVYPAGWNPLIRVLWAGERKTDQEMVGEVFHEIYRLREIYPGQPLYCYQGDGDWEIYGDNGMGVRPLRKIWRVK